MPTRWNSLPVQHNGGLITNLSPLQHGIQAPGSATKLLNFEPSVEGGYRRIEGFAKYDSNELAPYGEPVVQGSGQSGVTLSIANIYDTPAAGDTFTIDGVTGTYTIAAGGVSYDSDNKTATLTLEEILDSSPADKASVTFSSGISELTQGIFYFSGNVIVVRGGALWKSSGAGWTRINTPSYGTTLVDGGSQTGGTLVTDGFTSTPHVGDTFTIDSIEKVYTITAVTYGSGSATLSITPNLASSPADNAAITFLSSEVGSSGKTRFEQYNFDGTNYLIGVSDSCKPFKYDNTTFSVIDVPTDIENSEHVVEYKNHLWFAKDSSLSFGAPFSDSDFTIASGGGTIAFSHPITAIIPFRERLIVFTAKTIDRISGSTVSDFRLEPIVKDIGCINEDTVQEIGGDIIFLGPDGIRTLTATEQVGDINVALASRNIQSNVESFYSLYESFSSVTIRDKSQYRILGYKSSISSDLTQGFLGTQFAEGADSSFAWSELQGIQAYVSFSRYIRNLGDEIIIFANDDGFVYRMEQGNNFSGANIKASFHTPYLSANDPQIRKTWYKLHLYMDPEGQVSGNINLKFDFEAYGVLQPNTVSFTGVGTNVSFWGEAIWGTDTWGGSIDSKFAKQVIGSSFTVSIRYEFDGTDAPFTIDTSVLEYSTEDRQ